MIQIHLTKSRNSSLHKLLGSAMLCIAIGLLFVCPGLQAQQYLGSITGTITDSTGAVIPGATVTAVNAETHFTTAVTSNANGAYNLAFLNPGTYSLKVQATGFSPMAAEDVPLVAGASKSVNFSLKVGQAAGEKVEVTSSVPLIDTSSANLQTTISQQEAVEMPNVGRNSFVLSTLAAGIYSGTYMQSKASTYTNPFSGVAVQIASNGSSGHNRLTLDGTPDDPAERLSGASYTGFVPSPESVQEVNVQVGMYDAQYGHGDGVVTNSVLRSGTNDFHGSIYESFRNTYMNANTYERVPTQATTTHRSNDQWEQPGLVLTGPVRIPHVYNGRDKTFFTLASEYLQLHQTLPYQSLVPTTTQLGGDFSGLCSTFNAAGLCTSGVQIYDPTSPVDANNNRLGYFPNNNLKSAPVYTGTGSGYTSTASMNAVGKALAGFFPAPNSSYSPTVNYISSQTSVPNQYYSVVTRIDQQINPNNKFSAKWFKGVLNQYEPLEGFPKGIGPTGDGYTVYRNNMGGSLDFISVLPKSYVLDARLGVIYHPFGLVYPGSSYNDNSLGMTVTALPYVSFPGTTMSDSYATLASGNAGQVSEDTLSSASVMLSKQFGLHSVKAGFEGNLTRYNVENPMSGINPFSFDRSYTQKNYLSGDSASGNPLAAMLLGYPSSGSYGVQVSYALQQKYMAFFAQDDWHFNNRLTLNMGLRWDYESPFSERFNRLNTGFCTTCTNPLQSSVSSLTLKGGLTFANSSQRYSMPQVYTNFQPRFGFAYQITPKLVLRGGIGLTVFNTLESPLAQGFTASTSYVASTNGYNPVNSLTQPYPSITTPTGSSLGLLTQEGQNLTFPDPDHSQPRMLQWSTSMQAQLPLKIVLQAAYSGNKVERLEVNKQLNSLPTSYLNPANAATLNASVANPFAGLIPGSSINSATITQYKLYVPYPEFTGVQDNYMSIGSVVYNALQVTASRQMSRGFAIQANFTYQGVFDRNVFLNPQDTSLFHYRDSQPSLISNVFGTYRFPNFDKKAWYVKYTVGNWSLHGVLRAYNGSLISNPGSTGGSQYGTGTTYTQLTSPKLAYHTYQRYFNTCYENTAGALVYTVVNSSNGSITPGCDATNNNTPAFQQNLPFTRNTLAPYMNVRQLVHPLADLSLFKKFPITEGSNFEIRGEFFNALNTPNFGGPGTGITSSTWGVVTMTQANDPRLIQLTARYNF
jgi:hypothetical protein